MCVGIVTGPHGVRGGVRIKPFTADPAAVAGYGPVVDETGTQLRLTVTGEQRDRVLARIDGVDDRTAAEALKGRRLYVERSALPAAGDDEYYHVDLIGLRADLRPQDGADTAPDAPFGRVAAVHDHGAGAILEVTGETGETLLVPFTRETVPIVDLAAGRVVITPIPGLFDEREEEA